MLLEALKSCQIFDDNDSLKPRSDKVWETVADSLLPQEISSDTLNFYVRNNRWILIDYLRDHFNISIPKVSVNETSITNNATLEYVPYNCITNNDLKDLLILFNLELTESKWKCIYPESKIYKDKGRHERVYKMLRSGWTDLIVNKCYDKIKIPCAFVLSLGKIFELFVMNAERRLMHIAYMNQLLVMELFCQ